MTVAVVAEESLSGSFMTMGPLYEKLLQQKFSTSQEAIQFCRETCLEYGFTIKQETNQAIRSIYIYCSSAREPDSSSNNVTGTSIIRKRPSSLTTKKDCQWRVVLAQNEFTSEWIFRKSMNPHASEHNHALNHGSANRGSEGSGEREESWPQEVIDKIIQLARLHQQKGSNAEEDETNEIREAIKLEFPELLWNEHRFLTCLSEERKRQRQKRITERVQKLIMASTKLCSVVAANEDWASCVEGDLSKMLESYRQMTRVSNQSLDSMVDLQLNMIHSEIDSKQQQQLQGGGIRRHSSAVFTKQERGQGDNLLFGLNSGGSKKRKMMMAAISEGVQIMSIPSCTLFIRSQPLRSLSEPSGGSSSQTSSRRSQANAAAAAAAAAQQQAAIHHHHQQQQQQAAQMAAVQQAQAQVQQMAMHHQQHAYDIHHHQPPFHVGNFTLQTSPISSPSSTSSIHQRMDYGYNRNDMLQSPPIPDSTNSGGGIVSPTNYHQHHQQGHSPNHYSTASGASNAGSGAGANNVYPFSPYPTSTTNPQQSEFTFDQGSSYGSSGGGGTSTAPLLMNQRHRNSGAGGGGYYTSQRMMMQQQQQEYEHLPIIRSTATTAATANNNLITTATMVQQQQHHHHHHHPVAYHHNHHLPPSQQQQNWS